MSASDAYKGRSTKARGHEGHSRSSTSSDVVAVDGRGGVGAMAVMPNVGELNVHKSTVHIGPKIINVTQHVETTDTIKGRILGLEVVSAIRGRRLRCSVAVFVCWSFVVASGLACYLFQVAFIPQLTRLDIGLNESWYLRRGDWQAMPAQRIEFRDLPVKYVIIGHSALNFCIDKYECIKEMIDIQQLHQRRGFLDIGPHYLVGGEGSVFEGRGANVVSAMVALWNVHSVTIMLLGDYTKHSPQQVQFDNVNHLLHVLVKERVLERDYILYGYCQVIPYTVPPGPHVMASMGNFTNWDQTNKTKCLDH